MAEVGRLQYPVDPMLCCEHCWQPILAVAVYRQGLVTVVTWQHKDDPTTTLRQHPVRLSGWRQQVAVRMVLRTVEAQHKARDAAIRATRQALKTALASNGAKPNG